MDSRERVLASINHERPDRIPADLWAEPGVWDRLVKDLGVGSEEDVRKLLQIDVRYVSPVYPADTITNGVRQNMWGERWEKTSTVFGYEWEHTRRTFSRCTIWRSGCCTKAHATPRGV